MTDAGVRTRLVRATVELLRRRGADGFGVTELLAESGVARRSLYQHFPGGKTELVAVATESAAQYLTKVLDRSIAEAGDDPGVVIHSWVAWWKEMLEVSDYGLTCPLAIGALSGDNYPGAAAAAAQGFITFQGRARHAYERAGVPGTQAAAMASVAVSAIEGAIIQARALRSLQPLDDVADHFATAAATR